MFNRREFMKRTGDGMILLGGLSFLPSCGGIKRADLAEEIGSAEPLKGLGREEMEILHLASLAPSGHNTQPWTVKVVEPGHWVIGSEEKRWLPAVDPENRELFLSIGAFLENLLIAAGSFGYRAGMEILARNPKDREIANLRLKKGKMEPFPLEKMRKRRTVRSNLLPGEIKGEDLKFVTRHELRPFLSMPLSGGHSFYFPQNSPQGKYLREGTVEANRKQAFRHPAQEELANWIRWSNRDAENHRNGLTPESMEIGGFAGWYVRNFYDRHSVLSKSFHDQTVDLAAKQAKSGAGWLVVTSPDSSIPTLLEYGRVFENMLLKIRERKIAVHPMTQMLEEEPWKKQTAKELGLTGEVQWILRIGYLKSYPDPVSLRMPVSRFVQGS
ncbi:MAG: nitroreductase [Syntrophaceae bacterium]|nr:nitroreductase [Syntrophaceae bacterium]